MSANSRLVSTNQALDGGGTARTAGPAFSLVIAPANTNATIQNFSGYCNGAGATTPYWIMFFAQATVPVNGTRPIFQEQVLGVNGFKFDFLPNGISSRNMMNTGQLVMSPNFGGLVAVLSTTGDTLTIATGGNTMELDVWVDDFTPILPAGTTVVGDLTSPVTSLQVWTEAAGLTARKKLYTLEVDGTNLTTATHYIMIFAKDTNVAGDAPMATLIFPIALLQLRTLQNGLDFGDTGLEVYQYDGTTKRLGCTIMISSTKATYTAATGTACIRATYK